MVEPAVAFERVFTESEIDIVATQLVQRFQDTSVWLLEGTLGAGKTRLVKALCASWQVKDEVTSPSFPIVNEYKTDTGNTIYHLDLYRLHNLEQAAEIGIFEIAESGYVCLIEWASAVGYRPAARHLTLQIDPLSENTRRLSVRMYEN